MTIPVDQKWGEETLTWEELVVAIDSVEIFTTPLGGM